MAYKFNPFTSNFDDTLSTSEIQASGFPRVIKGTVATAAATVDKEVTISGYTLTAGDILCITYTLGTTAASPTLAVNGGSAISIYLGSTAASAVTHTVGANGEIFYYYTGSEFQMFGSMRTTDADSTQAVYWGATSTAGTAFGDYKLLMQTADGKWHPLTLEEGVGTTKTISPQYFLINSPILYYARTTNVAQDDTFTLAYQQIAMANTLRYTDNQATRTSQLPIFLKGTIGANGFKLDATTYTSFLTQTLPTTDDGFVYIRLGYMYATNNMLLTIDHPIYQFKDGNLRQYIPTSNEYLKLDQTTPQTVENGMPLFEGGIKVPMNGASTFYGCNSPVVYNGADCYVSPDPEDPEDLGIGCVWYIEGEVILYYDDGVVTPAELSCMTGATTPTINLHITGVNFGSEEEPYWIYLTGYSDLNLVDFTAFEDTIFGLGGALVGVYTEVAFTYNATTDSYTKVATLAVCSPSTNTTWTDPMVVGKVAGGFIVDPITANILHTANYVHNGNYTCNNTAKIFRHKGQVKVGNGNYADYITAPLVANPLFEVAGSGALQFAMTFVPEVQAIGTVDVPVNRSIYVSGMYGTTVMQGAYANYSGVALGGWAAIQNAIFSETVTLAEGVAMRAGLTYAAGAGDYNMVVTAFACFQSAFTNLNNGTSSHTTLKHFETGDMGDKATATTAYGLYIRDNSAHATTSYGVYSLEEKNYLKKVQSDSYQSGAETGQTTTVTVVTDTRMNSGQLEKKTQVLTYTAGLLTAKGAESEWTATTDI